MNNIQIATVELEMSERDEASASEELLTVEVPSEIRAGLLPPCDCYPCKVVLA